MISPNVPDAPYIVYILRLGKHLTNYGVLIDGGWYVGSTNNFTKRLAEHTGRKRSWAKATKLFGVEYVGCTIPCIDYASAIKLEYQMAKILEICGLRVHGGGIKTLKIIDYLRMLGPDY